jgi:hypothetical protein
VLLLAVVAAFGAGICFARIRAKQKATELENAGYGAAPLGIAAPVAAVRLNPIADTAPVLANAPAPPRGPPGAPSLTAAQLRDFLRAGGLEAYAPAFLTYQCTSTAELCSPAVISDFDLMNTLGMRKADVRLFRQLAVSGLLAGQGQAGPADAAALKAAEYAAPAGYYAKSSAAAVAIAPQAESVDGGGAAAPPGSSGLPGGDGFGRDPRGVANV